jgi:hypothetical protein
MLGQAKAFRDGRLAGTGREINHAVLRRCVGSGQQRGTNDRNGHGDPFAAPLTCSESHRR